MKKSSTFQGLNQIQGLFKTTAKIQDLFKIVRTMSIEASEMEEGQIQQGARASTTRSGRKSRHPKETAFLFYD